jgi:hypothetical protein
MKFSITRGDVRIEVDANGSEANQLLQQLLLPPAKPTSESLPSVLNGQQTAAPATTEEDRFHRFWRSLGNLPRQVLLTLLAHPQGLSDIDLKEALHDHKITTLAGAMTAIAKGTRRMEINPKAVLVKTDRRDRQRKGWFFYTLGKLARDVLEAMQPEEKSGKMKITESA